MFEVTSNSIDLNSLTKKYSNEECGALVQFHGIVRNHNLGKKVRMLSYECFEEMALKEGEMILTDAVSKFGIKSAYCIHRYGDLEIGDVAVWIVVNGGHRDQAFKAARFIIDEVKLRVPIWKKEHYFEGDADWVYCPGCAHAHEDHHH